MKILLLGYSQIARRRVLPALASLGVETIDVASISAPSIDWPGLRPARRFPDYDTALQESDADVVYISTVNSSHALLTEKALHRGFHAIADKPAFLSLDDTHRLLDLAASRGRLLAEATVWPFHPRIETALAAFRDARTVPTRLIAVFSFPPLRDTDFRYRAELGGGALWDLGPYAMTPGRVFFNAEPDETAGRVLNTAHNVDDSFSVLATYPGGRSLIGTFGYNTGYVNRLQIVGPGLAVTMNRIFSPPADLATDLIVEGAAGMKTLSVPASDTFQGFLAAVFNSIETGAYEPWAKQVAADAQNLNLLRSSALPETEVKLARQI